MFKSSMPQPRSETTDYQVYVMPGNHDTATRYNLDGGGGNLIGEIGFSLAKSFLIDCGSSFRDGTAGVLEPREMVEKYAIVNLSRWPDFKLKELQGYTALGKMKVTKVQSASVIPP